MKPTASLTEIPLVERPAASRRAFTMIELLIVIGIIAILVAILIPVISGIRQNAWAADTRNSIQILIAAIERYQQDYRAYPGPISNNVIEVDPTDLNTNDDYDVVNAAGFAGGGGTVSLGKITMPENLVLGLSGGLRYDNNGTTSINDDRVVYDPQIAGQGPFNLVPNRPTKAVAYFAETREMSWRLLGAGKSGEWEDAASETAPTSFQVDDTIIPEYLDRYPDRMPILYLRPRSSAYNANIALSPTNNPVVTDGRVRLSGGRFTAVASYDLEQINAYTNARIGVGRSLKAGDYKGYTDAVAGGEIARPHGIRTVDTDATLRNPPASGKKYYYPYDAYSYLLDPASQVPQPRGQGRYILIAAGKDRVFGTDDDITSFGSVLP